MKAFDPAVSAELLKENILPFVAVELNFSGNHYYTSLDIPVHYNEQRYTPKAINFSDMVTSVAGTVDYVTVTFGNADLIMSAILLSEDVRNKTVKIYLGILDTTTLKVLGWEQVFQGIVDEWEIEEDKVDIKIANEIVLWSKKPLRNCGVTCPWTFKGTQCTYAGGETWCDKSYERCDAINNTDYFGGFRFAAAQMEKQIWWGQTGKVS